MSKYTFFNKILPDETLIVTLVNLIYKKFGYDSKTSCEKVQDIFARFKENYKIAIKYTLVNFDNSTIKEQYGLKKGTDLYVVREPEAYKLVMDENHDYNENRFLSLKAIGYILFDQFKIHDEIRLTMEASISDIDALAEQFAIEFLCPKWKLKYLKQNENLTVEKLCETHKCLNKRLAELRLK